MAEELLQLLSDQELCTIDAEWVKVVWESNFTEFEGLEQAVQSISIQEAQFPQILLKGAEICWRIVQNDEAGLWPLLQERKLCPRALLVLLFYCIENGLQKESLNSGLVASIAASQFYLALTSIPGAQAYGIFNSFLYLKTLDCVKTCLRRVSRSLGGPNMSRSGGGGGRGRGGRGNSSVRGRNKKSHSQLNHTQINQTNVNDDNIDSMMESLEQYLQSLWSFLDKFSLKNSEACLGATVSLLCNEMIVWDGDKASHFSALNTSKDMNNLRYLAEKSFACLHKASSKIQDCCGRLILRCLMPRLLLLNIDGAHVGQAPTAPTIKLRDLTLKFIFELMNRPEENEIESEENNPNNGQSAKSFHNSVCALLQTMCTKVPDKIEFRNKTAQTISFVLAKLNAEVYAQFLSHFEKFANSKQQGYRGFGTDLAPVLLACRADEQNEETNELACQMVARILFFRACDKAPTVRQRALGHISALMNTDNDVFIKTAMETSIKIDPPKKKRANTRNDSEDNETIVDVRESTTVTLHWIIARRSWDEKVNVRKTAVQLAHSTLAALQVDEELTNILKKRCSDSALSVRKQAAESLTDVLLRIPACPTLQLAWLDGVVPLVIDREATAQDKAVELIANVIFKNLNDSGLKRDLAWKLLVSMERQRGLQRFLQRAVRKMIDCKGISERLALTIEAEVKIQERAPACWMLLAELSSGFNLSPRGTRVAWYLNDGSCDRTVSYMARILASAVKRMSDDECRELLDHMKRKVESFDLTPDSVAAVVYAISRLIKRIANSEERGVGDCEKWCNSMSQMCERYLSGLVFNEEVSVGPGQYNEQSISRHLATLGEVVQYVNKMSSQKVFMILEALVASEHLHVQFSSMQRTGQWHSLSRPLSAVTNPSQPDRPPSSVSPSLLTMPLSIRSNAVNTLGKMCLQDEDSAKKCVAALVRELAVNKDATIRNNIMVVLSDLCIRYTSLVDRHVGTISRCLKDPSTLVRRQTLSLLTVLLKEDFLKWKGVLLYRFVSTLLDKDPSIRQFTQFCLINVLLARHQAMFSLHFLECVFYFNGVCHPSWEAINGSVLDVGAEDARLFSLRGKDRRDERMQLYKFMLRQFSDFERLNCSAKLSMDILGSVVDELIPFNPDTEELLSDALILLSCKEMKMKSLQSSKMDEDEDVVQQAVVEVQKKILVQTVKKAIKENVIPCAVALKHFLESKRSPAEKLLLMYLRELMKEHKNEIMEVLASDKQTANEIEYDLKRLEEEERHKDTPVRPVHIQPPQAIDKDKTITDNEGMLPPVIVENEMDNNEVREAPIRTPLRQVPEQEDIQTGLKKTKRKTTMVSNPKLKLIKEEPAEGQGSDESVLDESGAGPISGRAISTPVHPSQLNELTFQISQDVSAIGLPDESMLRRSGRRKIARPSVALSFVQKTNKRKSK